MADSAFSVYSKLAKRKGEKARSTDSNQSKKRKFGNNEVKATKKSKTVRTAKVKNSPNKSNDSDRVVAAKSPIKAKPKASLQENGEKVDLSKKKGKKKAKRAARTKLKDPNGLAHVVKQEGRVVEVDEEEIPQLIKPTVEENGGSDVLAKDPSTQGVKLLKWLLYPLPLSEFFDSHWEQDPMFIVRNVPNYYQHILTTKDIDIMLRENPLYFGRNIDVVKYVNDERVTENPSGRAKASIVWDAYASGYSIRILNPQTYNPKVHAVLATLQEYFGTMVGVNVYLTPAGSQGFAPHYDDIEAFVIQLEGRKHWKLYKSKHDSDTLARYSSKDFKRDDLGELIMERTLNAGDLLYFPRGCVHEACTDEDQHSLHLTISTYQCTSYADLLEKMLPETLKLAAAQDIDFRRSLPVGYLKHLGVTSKSVQTPERLSILQHVHSLMTKLSEYATVDSAADQMGRKFIYESLPPVLSNLEKEHSSSLDGDEMIEGNLINRVEIEPETEIRLMRYYCMRFVIEDGEAKIYHNMDNARVYHGEEEQFLAVDLDVRPIVELLIKTYPRFVKVEDLPHDDDEKKMNFVTELWDYGILMTKDPLPIID